MCCCCSSSLSGLVISPQPHPPLTATAAAAAHTPTRTTTTTTLATTPALRTTPSGVNTGTAATPVRPFHPAVSMDGTEFGTVAIAQTNASNVHLQAHQAAIHALGSHPTSTSGSIHLAHAIPMTLPVPHGTPVKAVVASTANFVPSPSAGSTLITAATNANTSALTPATPVTPTIAKSVSQATTPITNHPVGTIVTGTPISPSTSHTNTNGHNGVVPVAATVASSALPSSSTSTLHPPNPSSVHSRRPSPASILENGGGGGGGSSTRTGVVMATILDSNSTVTSARVAPIGTTTTNGNHNTNTNNHNNKSPMPKQHIVTATVLGESPIRSSSTSHAASVSASTVTPAVLASASRGVPSSSSHLASHSNHPKVVTATIIPALAAKSLTHVAVAARVTPIPASGKKAAAAAVAAEKSRRKRPLKGSHRGKLRAPDPLEDVDNGASVTRCICGSSEDDGFMICCEMCAAWQHGDCIGVDPEHVPEEYLCDLCDPEGEIHQARTFAAAAAEEEANSNGKRKRRKRSHMSLGKKKGRRTTNRKSDNHEGVEDDEDDFDDGDEHDDDVDESGSDDPIQEDTPTKSSSRGVGGGSNSHNNGGRNLKPLHLQSGSNDISKGMVVVGNAVGVGVIPDTPNSTTLTSPLFSSSSTSSSSHPTTILSPGGTTVMTLTGSGVNGGGGGISGASVTTSNECTPQASPTGETKLRSLISTMELLTNGQLTSPISTSAGMSLSQLSQLKFTYPVPGVSPPGLQSIDGGSPVSSNGQAAIPSPLTLHRQVSENTASAAMTVAGFSDTGNSIISNINSGVSHIGSNNVVKLEVFSPVLPPSMISVPSSNDFKVIQINHADETIAYRKHRTAQQQQQEIRQQQQQQQFQPHPHPQQQQQPHQPLPPLPSSSHSPSLDPSLAMTPRSLAQIGLMSPNTFAMVQTLTSVSKTQTNNKQNEANNNNNNDNTPSNMQQQQPPHQQQPQPHQSSQPSIISPTR